MQRRYKICRTTTTAKLYPDCDQPRHASSGSHAFSVRQMAHGPSPANTEPAQVCLVTGAHKGIGKAIARKLGSQHRAMTCVLGCRNLHQGLAAVSELRACGCDASFVQMDVEDHDSIDAAKRWIELEYGRLDVLVNNAHQICTQEEDESSDKNPILTFNPQADTRKAINLNFFGTLDVIQTMMPLLRSSPSPRIVNVASQAGNLSIFRSKSLVERFQSPRLQMAELEGYMREFIGDAKLESQSSTSWPITGYGVSKAGIMAMTKVLARDEPRMVVTCVLADPSVF